MAIFSEITVNLQLAMGRKTIDEFIDEAIAGDNAGILSVLVKRPEMAERMDAVLDASIRKGCVHCFKFIAGVLGEERFNKASLRGSHLPSMVAGTGSIEMVRALAELGYDLQAPNPEGKTLALIALEVGKPELFRFLVEAIRKQDELSIKSGKKPAGHNSLDLSFNDVPTLLEKAIRDQRLDEVKLLLANKASPNPVHEDLSSLGRIERMRREKAGKKSFVHMAVEIQNTAIIEALCDAGANPNPPGVCLLEIAMGQGDMSIVKLLARRMGKEGINAMRDSFGNTMLNRAVLDNNLPMVEFFLGLGADANVLNFKAMTPLCEAANNTRLDMIELLLKSGVDINQPINPTSQHTLLHNAVLTGNERMVQWLMHRNINVNAVDTRFQTALDLAVAAKNVRLIELLVDSDKTDINAGATKPDTGIFVKNASAKGYRRPPLQLGIALMLDAADLLEMNKLADVVHLLIDLKADVNAQDSNGTTALHLMAGELDRMKAQWGARGDRAPCVRRILKALVAAKANPNMADIEGKRPMDIARQGAQDLKIFFESGDIEILPPAEYAAGEANIAGRPMQDGKTTQSGPQLRPSPTPSGPHAPTSTPARGNDPLRTPIPGGKGRSTGFRFDDEPEKK
jgi:ankyrin repeat protein